MKRIYILLVIMTIIAISTFIYGYANGGSPEYARNLKFDTQRVNNLSNIKSEIENYAFNHSSLPPQLSGIQGSQYTTYSINDPETNQPYEYTITSPNTYELCATFKTDTKSSQKSSYMYVDPLFAHSKGKTCFPFTVTFPSITPTPNITCGGDNCYICSKALCGTSVSSGGTGGGCSWNTVTNACEQTANKAKNGEPCYYDSQCQSNSCSTHSGYGGTCEQSDTVRININKVGM